MIGGRVKIKEPTKGIKIELREELGNINQAVGN